jgi:hypothetical protein
MSDGKLCEGSSSLGLIDAKKESATIKASSPAVEKKVIVERVCITVKKDVDGESGVDEVRVVLSDSYRQELMKSINCGKICLLCTDFTIRGETTYQETSNKSLTVYCDRNTHRFWLYDPITRKCAFC